MTLADTSVWIDHLHQEIVALTRLLADGRVLVHPFVIGELAVGRLSQRQAVLSDLGKMKTTVMAADGDVLRLIDRHKLFGSGNGYIDAHLLTAALITPDAWLWTRDRRLKAVAQSLGVAATET